MGRRGFTLIELAMVLVIIGLVLGIGITAFTILVKRAKVNASKEAVNAAVEAVLGYTYSAEKLPDATQFPQIVRQSRDAFGKELVYIYDQGLTDYCGRLSTKITVEICSDPACTSPVQTVQNVAFIVLSGSGNYNNQTAGPQAVTTDTTIRVYDYGVNVDNYPDDINRVEPYDDIVKWVTLAELHSNEACRPVTFPQDTVLPDATEDTPYTARIKITGGKPPYTFGVWNGTSCDTTTQWNGSGLSVSSDGLISGTVNYDTDSQPGSITDCGGTITIDNICVEDSLGDAVKNPSPFTIHVKPQNVKILTETLPPAYEGSDYNITFSAMGGGDTYNWSLSGSLPPDLTFDNGQITGTVQSDADCSNPSPYTFTITAESCGMQAVKGFSLTVIDPDCNTTGTGSGTGGGGNCVAERMFNTGNDRYYIKGIILFGSCFISTGCTSYPSGASVSVANNECIAVYTASNCRRRSQEAFFYFTDLFNVDTNGNCEVNYNNGTLSDR
ncbi:type II secretion system protein [Persephonella sp.]